MTKRRILINRQRHKRAERLPPLSSFEQSNIMQDGEYAVAWKVKNTEFDDDKMICHGLSMDDYECTLFHQAVQIGMTHIRVVAFSVSSNMDDVVDSSFRASGAGQLFEYFVGVRNALEKLDISEMRAGKSLVEICRVVMKESRAKAVEWPDLVLGFVDTVLRRSCNPVALMLCPWPLEYEGVDATMIDQQAKDRRIKAMKRHYARNLGVMDAGVEHGRHWMCRTL